MPDFNPRLFLQSLSQTPGVYQMLDEAGHVLYVGKAKNLKQRLSSYFRASDQLTPKTQALVARIAHIETTCTANETEALLLEQNLIKSLKPVFNILLRDDKSYPFLRLSAHQWPQLSLERQRYQRGPGEWFGPYPNLSSVRDTLQLLFRVFRLRQCDDATFQHRSRPCLQYQIQRCSAPCTGEISQLAYQRDVEAARCLLAGKSHALTQELAKQMETAANALDFEQAARYRDHIQHLRQLQQEQSVDTGLGEVDVFALAAQGTRSVITLLQLRSGRLIATEHLRFQDPLDTPLPMRLAAFIAQHFLVRSTPPPAAEILLSPPLDHDTEQALAATLSQHFQYKIRLASQVRTHRAKWLELARSNAQEQLHQQQQQLTQQEARWQALHTRLQLTQPLNRIECFDISHTQGEETIASCVAFNRQGERKQEQRCFVIRHITPGDDYAAMAQAISQRYSQTTTTGTWPDVLVIDGGMGQLQAAQAALQALQPPPPFPPLLIGMAKGVSRKAGLETLFVNTPDQVLVLAPHSPALHLLQHLRDEAHRTAIQAHRKKRDPKRAQSVLDTIPGIGPKRRQALLQHFGGLKALETASLQALCQVKGINLSLAKQIHARLHPLSLSV